MGILETVMSGLVEIGLTHPQCKKITVAMKTLPRFSVSPGSITLRRVEPGTTITKKIRIVNNYGESFNLNEDEITSKNEAIRIASNTLLPANRGYELELEITPPAVEGRRKPFSDELSLGLSSGLQLKIPCFVFYAGGSQTNPKSSEKCTMCGPRIINPRTGKVTYLNPEAKSGS
jgi:hypothetical protein